MLQAMGWQEGKGLGRHQQGITAPISVRRSTTVHITFHSFNLIFICLEAPDRRNMHVSVPFSLAK